MEKTKIDIISGFLGAGKTTLIKKLLKDAFQGEQVVLIENEFGEIGIDGGFLKEAGIQIREMNSHNHQKPRTFLHFHLPVPSLSQHLHTPQPVKAHQGSSQAVIRLR